MINSPESGKKVSNKPKRANGRGSIYQITKPNGRKVWKAAIKDVNGKLRTKNFTKMASQTDLKTLMEFSGHTQVSTVMQSYVHGTSESMALAIERMGNLRPIQNL